MFFVARFFNPAPLLISLPASEVRPAWVRISVSSGAFRRFLRYFAVKMVVGRCFAVVLRSGFAVSSGIRMGEVNKNGGWVPL